MYKKVGVITAFEDIPWGTHIIVTGSIGGSKSWCQRLPGTFLRDNDNYRFISDYGTATCFSEDDDILMSMLEIEPEGGRHD